ncbi:MAG: hypothetical protein D6798_03775 [Deltaproteobacteria bacterium]|nr:MAG: hypothetical protein D6798_03775 [Deltaproteobacteria bacterium]
MTGSATLALLVGAVGLAACSDPPPSITTTLPPLPEAVSTAADGVPPGPVRPLRWLQVALSGEVRGEIEPCGCPTLPYGGFARRERLLESLPPDGPLVQLDAGELLTRGISTVREDLGERAAAVLDLTAQVGVQAWVPGPSDLLAMSPEQMAARRRPQAVSATWSAADGRRLFPASTIVEADGLRIGVVGLSAAPTTPDSTGLVQVRDPVEAAREALAELPDDLDLVVGLGNVADDDADRVAEEVDGFAALFTTTGGGYDEPRVIDDVLIVETPARGRYLQVMPMLLGSVASQPLELRLPRDRLYNLRKLRNKAAEDERAREALAAAEADLAAAAAGRNLAWLETRPLAEDLDGEATVDARLEQFKREVLDEAARRAAEPPPPSTPTYATAAACTTCHLDEFARWSFTDHAQASWQSLVLRDATGNAECLPCHTTGFGEPGGLGEITPSTLASFKAVQCEACHGPMAGHPDNPAIQAQPITEERCRGCHDPANSPDFDFQTYLPRASCQGGRPELHPL